jgi:tetratricopeptide (TPR) repeat protein/tRNA A-37 threonylcarbamoyl transferase component Bud32
MSHIPPRLEAALAGTYEIDREIGRGGSAIVYLARDIRHERLVALKVIHPKISATLGMDRFLREIRIAASLQHPNILPLLDSGNADGLPYFATPYVEGSTLRELLASRGQLSFDEACTLTREIADGLTYAHAQGIVHRDVKPGNVLLSNGHAVLADFGLARAMTSEVGETITGSGEVGGTVQYMSPEQVHGSTEIDERTDVYSLACITYEMLCGEPPFTGRTAWAVVARQMSHTAESLQVTRPGVSAETDGVIARALHKDPSHRFGRAADFANALELSFAAAAKPMARRKALVRGIAGMLIAIAAVISLFMWIPREAAPGLDAQSVMVFPLIDARGEERVEGAGEQVAIMIGAALDHVEPLRWIDGWDWLDPADRADMASWTIQQGVTIARRRGAAYVIDGRIMSRNDTVDLVLRLHDTEDGALIERSIASGLASQVNLPELGRQAVVRLLPSLIDPNRPVHADALSGFEPLAVAAWLQGEREYRKADFSLALDLFQRAVDSDSSMALAAIRGAQAASWTSRPQVALELIEIALEQEASLTNKQRLLANGLRSYYQGSADTAAQQLRDAISLDPEWSDAWMALGEVYYHLLPVGGSNTDRAESAFRSARRFDPDFTPPLVHLSELALRRGDVDEADALTSEFQSANRDSPLAGRHLDLMSNCVGQGPDEMRWDEEIDQSAFAVLEAGVQMGVTGAYPDCAVAAFRALREFGNETYAWSALVGLQSSYLAMGRHEEARQAILSAHQFEKQQKYFFVAGAISGAPFAEEAEAAIRSLEAEGGVMSATQLWAIGAWHATMGRSERVATVIATARERASEDSSTPSDSLLAEVLSAWMSLAQADTAVAIDRFEALAPVAPPGELAWRLWPSLGAERMMLAKLWFARGEYDKALRVAEYLDHPQPVIYMAYLPESLELRLQAAEALGEEGPAAAYRSRLNQLRRAPVDGGPESQQGGK